MPLTQGLQLPFGIQPVNPYPVDSWSGPYSGSTEFDAVSSANSSIPSSIRFQSMQVRLIISGIPYIYWYKNGTSDVDLVSYFGSVDSITASNLTVVSSSNLNHLIANDATFNGLVSASAGLTSSAIYNSGSLTVFGNTILQDVNLINLTASNISASGFISASTLNSNDLISTNNILTNISSSNISASGYISSSEANFNTLTSDSSILFNVTASNISASNYISASTLNSNDLVSTNNILTNITSSNISASGYVSSSFVDTNTLTSINNILTNITSSNISASGYLSASTLNSNDLVSTNNILINVTASNISASGYISGSDGWFNTLNVSSSINNIGTLSVTGSTTLTDTLLTNLTASNISASGFITASSIYDTGTLTVLGNTTLGDSSTDIVEVTGSLRLSGSVSSVSASFSDLNANRVVYTDNNRILSTDDDLIFDGTTLTATNINNTNFTSSNISASGYISSSFIDTNTLKSINNIFVNITSSNISASGFITASALNIIDSIVDNGTLTVFGNTLLGNTVTDTIQITGSTSISGSLSIVGDSIFSGNVSASGNLSASSANFTNLTSVNNVLINVTSSNISASGNVSSSTANINTITSNLINSISGSFDNISASKITGGTTQLDTLSVLGNSIFYGDLTVYGSSSIVNISSSTVIIGDNRIQLNAWSTGSFSQRYAGLDLTDSGSNNNITSSLLWDSLNNYWVLTNNQSGPTPIVTSSALILQGPVSEFGSEKQLQQNNFLKVETTVGNLTSSNLYEVNNELKYNGTISSSAISASSAFFNLDVLINGVLKVFGKIYAYAGIIGDVTGSLSGSSIIVNTITASIITSSTIRTGNAQIDGGNINNTVIGNITPSTGNFTYITASVISSSTLISNNNTLVNVTSSNISASGYISGSSANFTNLSSVNNILNNITSSNISASGYITGSNVYVENTITSDTGSFIYLNINNTGSAPTSYTDSGMPGEIRFDNNFIYIYTNNIWVRTPIVRWTT